MSFRLLYETQWRFVFTPQVIIGNDVVRGLFALSNLGHVDSVPRLLALAGSHSNSVVRVAAVSALRTYSGHDGAERHLVSTFRNEAEEHSVRMEAIEVLTSWDAVRARSVMDVLGVFVDNLDVDWETCAAECAAACVHRTELLCGRFCANKCGARAGHEVLAARFLSEHMELQLEPSADGAQSWVLGSPAHAKWASRLTHPLPCVFVWWAVDVCTQTYALTWCSTACDTSTPTPMRGRHTAQCACLRGFVTAC